jgi:hypothetical protein
LAHGLRSTSFSDNVSREEEEDAGHIKMQEDSYDGGGVFDLEVASLSDFVASV